MFMAWDILPKVNLQYFLTKLKNKFLMLVNYNKLGAKNILPFPYAYGSGTVHGLTVTVNEDGSVTASGQPTQNVSFTLVSNIITEYGLQVGDKLIFSESNVENNNASAALIYVNPSDPIDLVQGDYELTITSDIVTKGVAFILWFHSGVDLTTAVTFKPMLRLDTDPDTTWVSPAFTNRKLTELVVYLSRNKSHVSANPSTTTGTLTSIEIDGTGYTFSGAGNAQTVTLSKDLEGTANFDSNGVATVDANFYSCNVQSGNQSNYPWHRIALVTGVTGTYQDLDSIIMFHQYYQGGDFGILKISLRTNGSGGVCSVSAHWMIRYGINADDVKIAQWGTTGQSVYVDVFFKCHTYMRTKIYQMLGGRVFTLVDSTEVDDTTASDKKTSVECYVSVESAATEIHNQAYTYVQSGLDVAGVNFALMAGKSTYDADGNDIRQTYVKTTDLATVATSGSYNDLSNKPSLATVATSGSYNDLSNKPTIPAAQVNSNWNATSGVAQILNKPTNLNQFTNGPGYITGINKTMVVNALGYTPPTSDTNNAVAQTNTTGAASYRVLFSVTADDTNRTEGARKGRLYFDPGNVRLHLNNGYGFWGNVTNACTFQNGNDSNHAIVHGAYNNDGNQWGWWPNKDGWESLGVAYRKWGQIYSTNSAISTSDRNEKKDIVPLDESAKDFIMSLNPVSYKFKNGESGRTHYGMIAQDVEEEMTKLGMTTMDFAGLIKYPKKKQVYETINGAGQFKDIPIDGEHSYGLRYEEFMAPAIKTIQMLQEEVDLLKQRIDILEEQLNG